MDFLILGPLEARRDGNELPLGGAKQRALLALPRHDALHHGRGARADLDHETPPEPAEYSGEAARKRRTTSMTLCVT